MKKRSFYSYLIPIFILFILYVFFVCCYKNFSPKNVLYYYPETFFVLAIFSSTIICIISAFVFWCNFKPQKRQKKILFFVCSFFLVLPFFFFQKGWIADNDSIRKQNVFGNVTAEYVYSDVTEIDISVKRGIQYDIRFENGESLWIESYSSGVYPFRNDENLICFDKHISSQCEKEITKQEIEWAYSYDFERFLNTDGGKEYFKKFFEQAKG